ncbi:hypothetical protein BLJ79_04375 [Arthrobacter sp. UCD-GKA]|uniref:hypothetical protein n=1 Tax=Arthrobacter sp. UCD-GKA TaxID=1913576 RepID=UPI0008DDC4E6|nr:hypothetical protein [Arthrobacter sp. UCD-GKA]OIH86038.1 hypothetical protein BLJ79_04375 [Arthrobacter sp. UCD-GKA]
MAKHIATGTPTQVAHPWKSVVRTFVAAAVGIGVAWLVRTLGVDLTALSQPIIDSLTTGAWAVATGLAQWLLTRPQLQSFWAAIGLGTGVEKEPAPDLLEDSVAAQFYAGGYPIPDEHEPTRSPNRDQQ